MFSTISSIERRAPSTQAVFLASCRLKLHRDSQPPTEDLALVLEAVRTVVLPELLGCAPHAYTSAERQMGSCVDCGSILCCIHRSCVHFKAPHTHAHTYTYRAGGEEAPTQAKKGRKQRKTKETAPIASTDSVKEDICVNLAKLCTEVVTLGLDRKLVLVRHMQGWMDTVTPEALRSTSPVTGALMPMFYKLAFQLSLRAWDEPAVMNTFVKVFGALLSMTPASLLKGTSDGWSVKGCLAEMLTAAKVPNKITITLNFIAITLKYHNRNSLTQ
jgi:hypothetical protein